MREKGSTISCTRVTDRPAATVSSMNAIARNLRVRLAVGVLECVVAIVWWPRLRPPTAATAATATAVQQQLLRLQRTLSRGCVPWRRLGRRRGGRCRRLSDCVCCAFVFHRRCRDAACAHSGPCRWARHSGVSAIPRCLSAYLPLTRCLLLPLAVSAACYLCLARHCLASASSAKKSDMKGATITSCSRPANHTRRTTQLLRRPRRLAPRHPFILWWHTARRREAT